MLYHGACRGRGEKSRRSHHPRRLKKNVHYMGRPFSCEGPFSPCGGPFYPCGGLFFPYGFFFSMWGPFSSHWRAFSLCGEPFLGFASLQKFLRAPMCCIMYQVLNCLCCTYCSTWSIVRRCVRLKVLCHALHWMLRCYRKPTTS